MEKFNLDQNDSSFAPIAPAGAPSDKPRPDASAANQPQGAQSGNFQKEAMEKKVEVYRIPDRFLPNTLAVEKSKKGFLLVIAIILILGGVGAGLYLLFKKPDLTTDLNKMMDDITVQSDQLKKYDKETAVIDNNANEIAAVADKKEKEVKTATSSVEKEINSASTTPVEIGEEIEIFFDPGTEYEIAIDSDTDGLTDVEEIIFSTNTNGSDTDNDTYSDSAEIINLYNPAGSGSIESSPAISKYANQTYKYSILYPKVWTITQHDDGKSVIFHLGNDQFIQIITQQNLENLSLDDWYKKNLQVDIINPNQRIAKNGWQGITTDDGLVVYITKPGDSYIYTLTYNLGLTSELYYKTIFDMMVNSFQIT